MPKSTQTKSIAKPEKAGATSPEALDAVADAVEAQAEAAQAAATAKAADKAAVEAAKQAKIQKRLEEDTFLGHYSLAHELYALYSRDYVKATNRANDTANTKAERIRQKKLSNDLLVLLAPVALAALNGDDVNAEELNQQVQNTLARSKAEAAA